MGELCEERSGKDTGGRKIERKGQPHPYARETRVRTTVAYPYSYFPCTLLAFLSFQDFKHCGILIIPSCVASRFPGSPVHYINLYFIWSHCVVVLRSPKRPSSFLPTLFPGFIASSSYSNITHSESFFSQLIRII